MSRNWGKMSRKKKEPVGEPVDQIICLHSEEKTQGEYRTCTVCDQVRRFIPGREHPELITRGRIHGIPTYVNPPVDQRYPGDEIAEERKEAPMVTERSQEQFVSKKPDNWGQMQNWDKARWYDDQRSEIESDLKTMTRQAVYDKWEMAAGTLASMRSRWQRSDETPPPPPPPPPVPQPGRSEVRPEPVAEPTPKAEPDRDKGEPVLEDRGDEEIEMMWDNRWYKGYRQAVLDIFGSGADITISVERREDDTKD